MSATTDTTEYAKGDKGTFGETITNLTPGVKNIQAAYIRAGATHDHTPGSAGRLGSQEQHNRNKLARARATGDEKEGKEVCICFSQKKPER
jgi:hypothetical protein